MTVARRRGSLLVRSTPGFAVVACVDGRCVEMAGAAAEIWAAIPSDGSPVSVPVLVDELAGRHDMDRRVVEAAVVSVIDELVAAGCVDREG